MAITNIRTKLLEVGAKDFKNKKINDKLCERPQLSTTSIRK